MNENFAFRFLWHAADHYQEWAARMRSEEEPGTDFLLVGEAFLRCAAFEGFLNHVGSLLRPAEWQRTAKTFARGGRYPGLKGKCRFLCNVLGVDDSAPDTPVTTFSALVDFRNDMAHPRRVTGVGRSPDRPIPDIPWAEWVAQEGQLESVRGDLPRLADQILERAKVADPGSFVMLTPPAFGPLRGYSVLTWAPPPDPDLRA